MKPALAYSETSIRRVETGSKDEELSDVLAVEEPLEIRVGFHENGKEMHKAISITMRTPGDDAELAAGFLFTEGIIRAADQIEKIRHCGLKIGRGEGVIDRASTLNSNTIRVDLKDGIDLDLKRLERHFYTSSSCGVCGKSSIDALHTGAKKLEGNGPYINPEFIHAMPSALLAAQTTFEKTGGLHASVIFDLDGNIDVIAEDVGRHNALDKVIGGKLLKNELPLSNRVLMVSGRASFELVQKALMAGISVLAAVGAPSSLAVELAREFGMTLIGFVRNDRFNIYTGPSRIRKALRNK